MFTPSEHNLKILDIAKNSDSHIICRACAGSGKTTQLKFLAQELQETSWLRDAEFVAFANRNAQSLEKCLPKNIKSSTTHQFMLRVLQEHFHFQIKLGKTWLMLRDMIQPNSPEWKLRKRIVDLVSRAKAEGLTYKDDQKIFALIEKYGLPSTNSDKVVDFARQILDEGKDLSTHGVDFDDMLYLPIIYNLPIPQRSLVAIDECQDFSAVQLQLLEKFAENGTRIFAVGDPAQAIYGFRGALSDSFERVCYILKNSKLKCEFGHLPISYRLDRENIKYANGILGSEDMMPRKDAGKGIVTTDLTSEDLVANVGFGDIIECRHWAPIMKIRYFLWKSRKRCVIMGDHGEKNALISHAKELSQNTKYADEFVKKVQDWELSLSEHLSGWQLNQARDVAECLKVIAPHTDGTTKSLISEINSLYCKPKPGIEKCAVLLGTIHSFKGDEANRVWRLSSKAPCRNDEDTKQELNCDYVAATRGKHEYHMIKAE